MTESVPSGDSGTVSIPSMKSYGTEKQDRDIAARFAPVIYQALGDNPRFDYITKFDFDGDWKGNNNWDNANNPKYPLPGYIYFSVSETSRHYFISYAAYHPRDYKGGEKKGAFLSDLIQEGVKLGGKYDPTGLSSEAILAHENDLEGCLIVVEKNGSDFRNARVLCVETLAHNKFLKYTVGDRSSSLQVEQEHPWLYAEPKGHGMKAYQENEPTLKNSKGMLRYTFTGSSEDPNQRTNGTVGYDLVPIFGSLWPKAQNGTNETFGTENDYGTISVDVYNRGRTTERKIKLGLLGNAFLGTVGGKNMARPPWGWFSHDDRERPLGEWFFDPAKTTKRHFQLNDDFPTAYIHNPILGIFRTSDTLSSAKK